MKRGKLQTPSSKLHPPSSKALWRTRRSSKIQASKGGYGLLVVVFVVLLLRHGVLAADTIPDLAAANPEPILGEAQERIIHYESSDDLDDPVARLKQRLASGGATLKFDPERGYLPSLLRALHVPISSQSLVFSKTSSQRDHTSPKTPRAIYFSSDVSIGFTPDAPQIDVAAIDPIKGPVFYTLDQKGQGLPRFNRDTSCLQCHLSSKTFNVPGLLVRSVYTDSNGVPLSKVNGFVSGHNSSISDRWAGWYVSGSTANDSHLGNLFSRDSDTPQETGVCRSANVMDLADRFETKRYLSAHSDIVGLLVLEHQVRMQNLITQAHYETAYALDEMRNSTNSDLPRQRIAMAGEALLEYMLFRDEAPLKGRVCGISGFAEEFQRSGPADSKGCSFFQLDLETRLLRYPCSFLIYSPSFKALPREMKDHLWQRLDQILSGQDHSPTYADMPANDRLAIRDILRDTVPEFAAHSQKPAITASK